MTNEVVEATTNAVCTAQSVGDRLSDTVGKQAAEGQAYLKQALAWLTENGLDFAVNLLAVILILIVGGLVVKGITAAVRKALSKSKRVDELLRTFICSVVSKTGWAILFIIALGRLGVDVGPLVASLGVTGVVLGFAFKESLGSLASGLMIALNHPFKVGDYVIGHRARNGGQQEDHRAERRRVGQRHHELQRARQAARGHRRGRGLRHRPHEGRVRGACRA